MKTSFFLTEVAQDWDEHNLTVAQETLIEAEKATARRTDRAADPLLDTPNFPNIRGYMRWVMVQKHFEAATKKLKNIDPQWINLGGVNVLELRGKHTIVTPCHLLSDGDTPNETVYRRDLRVQNQVCPLLSGFANGEDDDSQKKPLRILLVHGGKETAFAYLRAYIDPRNKSVYRNLSQNIMLMPKLNPSLDFEPIDEPTVGLNDEAERRKDAAS